jgi:hypothetical protein
MIALTVVGLLGGLLCAGLCVAFDRYLDAKRRGR